MKLLAKIRSWFVRPKQETTDVLASLLRAASDDAAFGRRVEFVLRLPAAQREALVNTALHEMKLRGEPASVRAGFALLATEHGAAAVLRYLQTK